MRKLKVLSLLVGAVFTGNVFAQSTSTGSHSSHDAKASTALSDQVTIESKPALENMDISVGTWIEGTLSTIRDGSTLGGTVWAQFAYKLPENWKVGVLNRVGYAYANDVGARWSKLRLFAEKKGFIDTGDVGNKFTLRVEPRTTSNSFNKNGRIVDTYARFDFTVPVTKPLTMKFREAPGVELNSVSGAGLINNRIEVGPVVAIGSFLFNSNFINWQKISNSGVRSAGYGVDAYLEYGITDNLAVDLWAGYETPYNNATSFVDATEWALEMYYTF